MARSPSVLDRLKQLNEQRDQLMGEAKSEAVGRAQEAVDALNALGYRYALVEQPERRASRGAAPSRRGTRQVNADRPCPICGFKTKPPHDARAHRAQGNKKRAFTADELSAKGMQKA